MSEKIASKDRVTSKQQFPKKPNTKIICPRHLITLHVLDADTSDRELLLGKVDSENMLLLLTDRACSFSGTGKATVGW
jgi:hypothetical protein